MEEGAENEWGITVINNDSMLTFSKHYSKYYMHIDSFNPYNPRRQVKYYPCFTDGESEAERGERTCPSSQSQ